MEQKKCYYIVELHFPYHVYLQQSLISSFCCFHLLREVVLQNEDRKLWKLGTLPPGLITFYNLFRVSAREFAASSIWVNPLARTDSQPVAAGTVLVCE